jgi:hypothetical protein
MRWDVRADFLMSMWPGKMINYTLTALLFFIGAGAALSLL